MEHKTYRSKLSWGLAVLAFGPLILALALTVSDGAWAAAAIIAASIMFMMITYALTFYAVTPEKDLVVHGGPFMKRRIPISSIKSIEGTRTILGAPAWSLDRLHISFGKYDAVVISPVRKKEFIESLKAINPEIEIK